jgi:hypothetical protein
MTPSTLSPRRSRSLGAASTMFRAASRVYWLYATARRVLANHRPAERRRADLISASEGESLTASSPPPRIESRRVAPALELLHEDERELLLLVAWEGLDAAAVAAVFALFAERRPYPHPSRAPSSRRTAIGRWVGVGTKVRPIVAHCCGWAAMFPRPLLDLSSALSENLAHGLVQD